MTKIGTNENIPVDIGRNEYTESLPYNDGFVIIYEDIVDTLFTYISVNNEDLS